MVESTSAAKKIVVFGATGGTGLEIVKQGLQQGHKVTAFVRNPDKLAGVAHDNLTTVKAELSDEGAMENAIKGQDAVMIALGGRGLLTRDTTCSVGTRSIMSAMNKTGVKRVVVCSSYGVGPGNRGLLSWAVRGMLYHPLADKDE